MLQTKTIDTKSENDDRVEASRGDQGCFVEGIRNIERPDYLRAKKKC